MSDFPAAATAVYLGAGMARWLHAGLLLAHFDASHLTALSWPDVHVSEFGAVQMVLGILGALVALAVVRAASQLMGVGGPHLTAPGPIDVPASLQNVLSIARGLPNVLVPAVALVS